MKEFVQLEEVRLLQIPAQQGPEDMTLEHEEDDCSPVEIDEEKSRSVQNLGGLSGEVRRVSCS